MKPIKGYEFKYKATSDGKIWSSYKNGFLKPKIDKWGYEVVALRKNGKSRSFLVHRLVALTFIDNPCDLPTVNHIDGNKINNDAENLEWLSVSDNHKHAYKTGLRKSTKGKDKTHKLIPEEVREIRREFSDGASIKTVASKHGISYDYAYKLKVGKARKNVI